MSIVDAGQRAMFVHRVGRQPMLRDVALIPQAPLDKRAQFGAGMNFDFLGANHTPAALGLDRAVSGLGTRTQMPEHVTMRHLVKTIGCRHRADFNRLEQYVVTGIS